MSSFDPVYLSINDRPRAVLAAMDQLHQQRERQEATYKRRRWLPPLFFVLGLPFCALDWLLGYDAWLFVFVAVGCWVAGAALWRALRRARVSGEFAPHYATARSVIETLRDDLDPRRAFFGHLDLTGPEQPSKLFREGENALGLAVAYYRDEWLNLKAKLYDGNMLRFAAVQRVKVRRGYYKRSRISGKQKWKQPKYKQLQELKVRLSVNPNLYDIASDPRPYLGRQAGCYTINELDTRGGIISLSASTTAGALQSNDVLEVLRTTYSLLRRKATV